MSGRPAHHREDGSFFKPWLPPKKDRHGAFPLLRWMAQRLVDPPAPTPSPEEVPTGSPVVDHPVAAPETLRATFVGHATFLLQVGGRNVLTDPVFSERASPVQWAGPKRFSAPGLRLDDLPPIDVVVLSHDHYDHLDEGSVRALHERFGERITWVTPLAYREWFGERGIHTVEELDWWESAEVAGLRITAAPTQHWTRRGRKVNQRLWGRTESRPPADVRSTSAATRATGTATSRSAGVLDRTTSTFSRSAPTSPAGSCACRT